MEKLQKLSDLISNRNSVEAEIASLIGRPAHPGHIGEFIAAHVFGIRLDLFSYPKGSSS